MRIAVTALAAVGLTAGAAPAQTTPPPTHAQLVEDGRQLALRLCSGCHVVEGKADATAPAGLPSFRGIANRPDQTAERIRNVLINPHLPMPDMQLSRHEIDKLLAYVDSLRADTAGPPLTPRQVPPPKPTYPDPS